MKILFQGDSITDCGRNRENNSYLGHGYPRFVQGKLSVAEPGKHTYINRGISGNRIVDVYARIKADIDDFNRNMPLFKNIGGFKVRDEEFPKTTTLKIARNYK